VQLFASATTVVQAASGEAEKLPILPHYGELIFGLIAIAILYVIVQKKVVPNLEKAYKQIAQQVRIPGFRPGKVPARIIDQRVGRGTVLQEAVNEALPRLYGEAAREHELVPLGQPDIDITNLDDSTDGSLSFTAEVDVRPEVTLPDFTATVRTPRFCCTRGSIETVVASPPASA